jgi:carbonic anhydrase
MQTKTVSLFDRHIDKATLYGMQYHFHSPSEHSIDGKLLDLEMHVVHKMENKFSDACALDEGRD